jgi:hypothetical protein
MTQKLLKLSQEALARLKDVEKQVRELVAENKALKEALAQPTSSDYALGYSIGFGEGHSAGKALAQPEQEPVATLFGSLPVYDTTTPQRTEQEPVQQVGTIGHIGNGSTTLTRAIAPLLSKAQAQAQPEQEPVALPCCGYADSSAIKWNPYSQVVQCHNCGQVYTTPPQRTWVGLTDEEIDSYFEDQGWSPSESYYPVIKAIEAKLKDKNGYAEENT